MPFEQSNIEVYRLLLRVEVVLRELLRETLLEHFGPSWRKRLPGPLLTKIRAAEQDEDVKRHLEFARLGPLYYLTLGELLDLLQQAPGRLVLKRLGGELFAGQLANIPSARNAVGHSRAVSETAAICVRAVYNQIAAALTLTEMERLASRPDIGLRAQEVVQPLLHWLKESEVALTALDPLPRVPLILQDAHLQHWWTDSEFRPFDTALIDTIVRVSEEYNSLPPGLGSRETKRRLVEDRALASLIEQASTSLKSLERQ